jgi:hypothetical protein
MPTRTKVAEELNFLSDLISNRVRTIAGGVLAIAWALLIEGRGANGQPLVSAHDLTGPMTAAIATLIADVAQYGFGLVLNLRMYRYMQRQDLSEMAYDPRHMLYRLRQWMFQIKLALCAVASFWLVILLARAVPA